MDNVTVEIIVSQLCKTLSIRQVQLAKMIKVTESSISNNLAKTIEEVKNKKTGKRLLPLFLVVTALAGVERQAIIDGIHEPTIPNLLEERKESVLEAIQNETLPNAAMLIEKAKEGVESYKAKKERSNKRLVEAVETALLA